MFDAQVDKYYLEGYYVFSFVVGLNSKCGHIASPLVGLNSSMYNYYTTVQQEEQKNSKQVQYPFWLSCKNLSSYPLDLVG
jgi:hypothetical protein